MDIHGPLKFASRIPFKFLGDKGQKWSEISKWYTAYGIIKSTNFTTTLFTLATWETSSSRTIAQARNPNSWWAPTPFRGPFHQRERQWCKPRVVPMFDQTGFYNVFKSIKSISKRYIVKNSQRRMTLSSLERFFLLHFRIKLVLKKLRIHMIHDKLHLGSLGACLAWRLFEIISNSDPDTLLWSWFNA